MRSVASRLGGLNLLCLLVLFSFACDRTSSTAQGDSNEVPRQKVEPKKVETTAAKEVKEEPVKEAAHKPLLWQIDGKSGPVYLLGTVHVGFDAKAQMPEYVWDKFEESRVFYMETDLGKAQLQAAQRSALPEGKTLDQMLSKENWELLDKYMGGVASDFRSFKPWFIVSLLTVKMLPKGAKVSSPMDQVIHADAKKAGKELRYLEEPDYQLSVLEETLTIEELAEMIENFEEQKSDLATLLDAYKAGDIKLMQEVSFKDLDRKPEMYEKLFYTRNVAWIPQIEEAINGDGYTFFAFGAGHLLGERGVLDLLEKDGYKPYRVTAEVVKKQEGNKAQVDPK